MSELYHAYSHKYIDKYMGRSGKWIYIYPGDKTNGQNQRSASNKEMYKSSLEKLRAQQKYEEARKINSTNDKVAQNRYNEGRYTVNKTKELKDLINERGASNLKGKPRATKDGKSLIGWKDQGSTGHQAQRATIDKLASEGKRNETDWAKLYLEEHKKGTFKNSEDTSKNMQYARNAMAGQDRKNYKVQPTVKKMQSKPKIDPTIEERRAKIKENYEKEMAALESKKKKKRSFF